MKREREPRSENQVREIQTTSKKGGGEREKEKSEMRGRVNGRIPKRISERSMNGGTEGIFEWRRVRRLNLRICRERVRDREENLLVVG